MSGGSLPPKNRWWFRVIAVLFVPLLVLGGLEGALRLTGYGYPTSFFLERHLDGERVLVENEKFGWRFFPREMARSPSPLVVRANKPAGTYRIFLFGESAALGDPRPAYGVGRYLEALLRERFSGTDFEVVCVAMTAINSHAILPIARDCARYQGDLWILYMGNNEMEGPFGANPILGARAPRLSVIRATLALRGAKLGQLIQDLGRWIKGHSAVSPTWEGMKMFLEHQLPPNDPGKQVIYAHFRKNLEDIVRAGFRSGAKPILCTVASNLKDCPPFGSLHSRELKESDRLRWEALYNQAEQLESTNQFQEARQLFGAAARIDSQFAELQFRVGQCSWGLTNYAGARASFEQARDLDALPFRTDASLNAITRDVAGQFAGHGAGLVDAEAELARQSPEGVPGEEFFYDHVHLNFDGNYRLARLLAQKVEEALPASMTRQRKADWASAETCERSLGLTDWNRNSVYESMLQRLFDAPFTNQLNHVPRAQALVAKIKEVRDRMHPRIFLETRAAYEEALARSPRDFRLPENFAEFLEATGDLDEAIAQWRRVMSLLPHHHAAYFQAGRLLSRQKKYPEAKDYLLKALNLRPDLVDGRIELGQVLFNERKPQEALAEYAHARSRRPEDVRVLVLVANALAAQNKRAEAMASLREAIRLRPSYWEARYLLGVELAKTNQVAEALDQFKEVIRLRPDYAVAHFNLGVAFAKQERLQEAALEFQETLRLDPNHQLARQYLQGLQPLIKTP